MTDELPQTYGVPIIALPNLLLYYFLATPLLYQTGDGIVVVRAVALVMQTQR